MSIIQRVRIVERETTNIAVESKGINLEISSSFLELLYFLGKAFIVTNLGTTKQNKIMFAAVCKCLA